jgi:dipeptidyl aminopeptidase/acylaminoacyl peptidase
VIIRYLAALAAVACCCGAKAAPLEAYGQLPSISDVKLSPDGDKIAYITHDAEGNEGVVAATLNPAKQLFGGNFGHAKLRSIMWADETRLLVILSRTKEVPGLMGPAREWYLLDCVDLTTGKATPLMNDVVHGINAIFADPERRVINGRSVIFVEGLFWTPGGEPVPTLFKLALPDLHAIPVRAGGDDWQINAQGVAVANATYNEGAHHWHLWINNGGRYPLDYFVQTPIDMPTLDGFSPDGASLIVDTIEDGKDVYRPISLKDAKPGEPIARYGDFTRLLLDPVTRRIIGGVWVGATASYTFFDAKDQAAWDAVVKRFLDEDVELESFSDDRSKMVVKVTGQAHGIIHVLVDTRANRAFSVGDAYPGLTPDDLAGVEEIEYKAADGRKIPAFLTLPNGRPAKNLPLIVLPHGGPSEMDEPGFDWPAQALASRGYAVLQPQFRGSDGYGWAFMAAGFGEWGRKMQTDLSDGVRALGHAGIIDPKRVCIVGGSYGGYAALAGAAIDTGVYRCAVSFAGVADLRKFLARRQEGAGSAYTPQMRYWDRYMGTKNPQDPSLDAISPIKHLDKVTIPVLLIHGKDDTVVPFEQSQMMADALKAAGKPVEFVVLPGEDHWLSRSETRLQMLQATVKFLEANNPPG